MTPKDRVFSAFAHEPPDRVPLWIGASSDFWEHAKAQLSLDEEALRVRLGDDFRRVFARLPGLPPNTTVMGIERHGLGYGQPVNHPLADADLAQIDAYPWPDPADLDVSHLRAEAWAYGGEYAILGGDWAPFWHDAIDLFGMERLCYLFYDAPELVDAVLVRLVDYYAEASARIFDAAAGVIDIYFMGNDYGSQTGPLVSEGLFKRFLLSHQSRLIHLAHDYGVPAMLHCCGGIAPLIPSLMEAGLDALHAVQPSARGMDLATLKREFGAKMVFNGAIDSQHVLIAGNPASVREQTRKVLEIMAPGGGYIAGASHDTILGETPLENVLAMCDAIREYPN